MRELVKVKRKDNTFDVAGLVKKVESTFPGVKVKEIFDYSGEWYMVMATDKDDIDYNSPYYLVGKTNGRVCTFNPLDDLDKFDDALKNKIDFEGGTKSK